MSEYIISEEIYDEAQEVGEHACRIEHEQLREMLIELKNLKHRYQQLEQLTVEIYRSYKSFVLKILRETLHANTDELESKLEELGVDIND